MDVFDTESLPEVRPYIPGTPLSPAAPVTLPYPIILSPIRRLDFYMTREGFDIVALFKNPMMMMMLVGGVMVFAMPYIMVRSTWCVTGRICSPFYRRIWTLRSYKTSRNVRQELATFRAPFRVGISGLGKSFSLQRL